MAQFLLDGHPLLSILMKMMDGVVICDASACIHMTNGAFRRMFNVASASSQGLPLQTVLPDAAKVHKWVARAINEGISSTQELAVLFQNIPRAFQVQIKPLTESVDGLSGCLLVFHDITAETNTEKMRRDFVANVSHELRTPLSAIKGYAETLLDGALEDDPDVARDFVNVIYKHSLRLSSLVEDLLDLSKLEAEGFQPELHPESLKPIVDRVVALAFDNAAVKQIRMSPKLPPDLPAVLANAGNLEQVFTNLIDNAIKYSPENGRVTIAATVVDRRGQPMVQVSIADTGIGIEPKHFPRLFERFYRVDKARSRDMGGTGLGLAIVKHIIQYHGGEIWVNSTPNVGSTFYFTLQIDPALQAA